MSPLTRHRRGATEASLRDSEARYRAMVEAFDGLVYVCSQDYRVEFMNQRLIERTGRDATGEPCYRVLHDRDEVCPWCVNERVMQGETVRWEVQSPKDGRWYHVVNTPIAHTDGRLSKQAMIQDITDRKCADAALHASEERYRRLLESVTDYVYTVRVEDRRPVATTHGPGCQAVTGYTPEEYAADPYLWHHMVHPDDRDAVSEHAARMCAGEAMAPFEHRITHRDGSIRWVRNTCVPRLDDQSRLIAYDGLITDISERKRAELALRESEEKYRTLFEASADAIFLETLSGRVLDCNASACRTYGHTKTELIGCQVADLIADASPVAVRDVVDTLVATRGMFFEALNRRRSGEVFPCEVSLQLVTVGGEPRAIAYVRDISERRRREEEIGHLQARLEEHVADLEAANRELESFSFSVSHDLRTPLVLIGAFSRLLQEEQLSRLPAEAQRYLALIRHNTKRMEQLIDDLLAFSRASHQPLGRKPVATAELVRQVVEELRALFQGRRVEITLADLPACRADPALLKQVFVNLLSNAIKFTRPRESAAIAVGFRNDGGRTVFYVKDNGVGFDMRHAQEVFGVFKRFHEADGYDGTGVGLAIAQRIVHRHGGLIWAEAEVDRGATFSFTLGEGSVT